MVPDMIAVYHLQKNKGSGVYDLIWNRQITPFHTRQKFQFPFTKSQQPSEELRGALALIDIQDKQRKMVSGHSLEVIVGHEHSVVLIVQQGPTCSILTSLLCVTQLFLTSKKRLSFL